MVAIPSTEDGFTTAEVKVGWRVWRRCVAPAQAETNLGQTLHKLTPNSASSPLARDFSTKNGHMTQIALKFRSFTSNAVGPPALAQMPNLKSVECTVLEQYNITEQYKKRMISSYLYASPSFRRSLVRPLLHLRSKQKSRMEDVEGVDCNNDHTTVKQAYMNG